MTRKSYFTTFEISQICEVNPTTVQNWVKDNKLKAFVTPGGHRRIKREDLYRFLVQFKMPVPPEFEALRPLVMIVDDETVIREMLVELIKSTDCDLEVSCAENGIDALLKIGERAPDLLILDIRMPGMNGVEVCRRLKSSERNRAIKIAAISGDTSPSMQKHILEAGVDLFFTKPLDVLGFRTEVLKLIGF
jgi:excisionase family DNA binding protein